MENLHISGNKKYLMKGDKPFFWLGDTAWMLFTNISYEEAYTYLKTGQIKVLMLFRQCLFIRWIRQKH